MPSPPTSRLSPPELDPETVEIRSTQDLGYPFLALPIVAFGDLWVAALEHNVVLSVDAPD
jgi:hypothetical protein